MLDVFRSHAYTAFAPASANLSTSSLPIPYGVPAPVTKPTWPCRETFRDILTVGMREGVDNIARQELSKQEDVKLRIKLKAYEKHKI
jgi:hypothetical protein